MTILAKLHFLPVIQCDGIQDRAEQDAVLLMALQEEGERPFPDRCVPVMQQPQQFFAGKLLLLSVQFHLVTKRCR